MSDQGQNGSGKGPASARTGAGKPDLNLDTLFDDPEDEPESGAAIATARASVALTSRPLSSGVATSDTNSPSAPRRSQPPSQDPLDLELEAQALHSSPEGLLRPSVPSSLPIGVALRAIGTPAPPMAVPSLRPPEATPPPLRTSAPPPPLTAPAATFTHHPHDSRLGTRLGLPEAAPAPVFAPEPTLSPPEVEPQSAPTQILPPLPAELYPTPSNAKTLPGLAPPSLHPAALSGTVPKDAIPEVPLATGAQVTANPEDTATSEGTAPTAPPEDTAALAPEAPPRRNLWLGLGLALLVALVLGVWMQLGKPAPGVLVISVSGPDSEAVPQLSVYVDETLRCTTSPCRVPDLSEGTHQLRAEAPGYLPSKLQELELRAGTDTVHNLLLTPVRKTATLSVSSQAPGVRVLIDGKDLGPPPVEISDLDPGEHVVRVEGERFFPLDQTVVLEADENRSIGPLLPRVRLGSLTLRAGLGAEGATLTLDGQPVPSLPVTLDLDAQRPHALVAEKPGFDRFEREISFDDGNPELGIDVTLLESYAGAESTEPTRGANTSSGKSSAGARTAVATLNMNSIPTSTVLLDGKRLGQTPRVGVSTKPGVHSVTFVHPQHGRKSVQVKLAPGQNRTVSVRF